jgi:sterol desaturase/sphingolipid hydroxylase (fatty acid hydroxylase superfamily)
MVWLYGAQWWQVALAVLVYFGVGALWYSPVLFAHAWMRELNKKREDLGDPTTAMVVTLLGMILLVLVEAYFIRVTGTNGAYRGALLGAKLWLGFVATTALINSVFQGSSRKLYAIDLGYHLVGMVLAGAILGL